MPVVNSPRSEPKNYPIINKQEHFHLQGLVHLFQAIDFAPYIMRRSSIKSIFRVFKEQREVRQQTS